MSTPNTSTVAPLIHPEDIDIGLEGSASVASAASVPVLPPTPSVAAASDRRSGSFVYSLTTLQIVDAVSKALGNPGLTITPAEHTFLTSLIRDSPETFEEVNQTILGIMSDGRIDFHDIPQIVLVISHIFRATLHGDDAVRLRQVNLIHIVRLVLDALLDSGLLPLPAAEIAVIKRIVDTSLGLLATELPKVAVVIEQEYLHCRRICCCLPWFNFSFSAKRRDDDKP